MEKLFTGTFYIHEGFAAACLASVYKNFVGVAYVEKSQHDLIQEATSISENGGTTTNAKNVAVITFNQPVIKYDYGYWLGTQTYIQILNQFKADPSIAGVVVKMDTGGGQVYGTPEFYDYVIEFRKTKPYVVYASGYLCSGGFYMAAPADWIVVNKRADALGSIGAYGIIVDYDGIIEKLGGKVHTIYAEESPEKNEAYRDVIEKGDYKKYIKKELSPTVVTFQEDMKAVRPQLDPRVFLGGVWPGHEAVSMGLADEEGTEETAIAKVYELSESKNNNKNQKKKSMSTKKSLPNIQKVLGIPGDGIAIVKKTISGKRGFFIEEAQLDALEANAALQNSTLDAATSKVVTAEGKVTALEGAVNSAIKTAGLDAEVEANATTETKISLLGSKVVEYGKNPGAKITKPKADGDIVDGQDDDQEKSTSLIKSM